MYYTVEGQHGVARFLRGDLIDTFTFEVVSRMPGVVWWGTSFDIEAPRLDTLVLDERPA